MKKKYRIQGVFLGMLIGIFLFQVASPAFAALAEKTIKVFTGVNVYVNDQKIQPKDANGNPVEVFVYNGTTYLPIRAVGNALGLPVDWDGKTQSAYVGKHAGEKPAVWLKDLPTFVGDDWKVNDTMRDNTGVTHQAIYNTSGNPYTRTYLINGQYSAISGTFFQLEQHKSSNAVSTISIYGDGDLLYTADVSGGVQPIDFNVDLTGVLKLEVKVDKKGAGTFGYVSAIGECGLWS